MTDVFVGVFEVVGCRIVDIRIEIFEDTGNVEAYLAYRMYQDKLNKEFGEDKQVDIYGGESNGDSNP